MTTHPATRAMVDYYAGWYDRHFDLEWQDLLLTLSNANEERIPVAFLVPRSAADLRRMGRSFGTMIFPTAGNVTHTPAYGNLIALGILDAVQRRHPASDSMATAAKYRDWLADSGRFLTFSSGGATIGYRFREDPNERASLRLIKETDAGIVVRGKVGMHTSVPFADDVYIGAGGAVTCGNQRATFVVAVSVPGVTVVCRRIAARHNNLFLAPLSSQFDELDAQLWLEDVFIPWDRVFLTEPPPEASSAAPLELDRGEGITSWLFWHQLYCWLSKAEFTLGLALACTDAMGLREHQQTLDYLVDLIAEVQTVRSCLTAAELDPQVTQAGHAYPGLVHIAAGSIAMLKARQRITELLRVLPGSSLVMAPADTDLAAPEMAAGLEETFGGGYTALQRSALLNLAWDHISSGLDGRESAFELHANGGIPTWRNRLRRWFSDYNELANGVVKSLDLDMPVIDLDSLRQMFLAPRRPVSMPSQEGSAAGPQQGAQKP
jgi:aromatic ring hydroxylase